VVQREARFLVRQRPAGIVNAHLWEFPNAEVNGETDIKKIAQAVLGFRPESVELSRTIKHTITRYRITLEVFRGVVNGKGLANDRGLWLHPRRLRRLPFASAHKKILHDL
jgi:A/G-specific adenine glycosylase